MLIIHGTADTIIPHTESQRLHQSAAHSELWQIDGFGHIQAAAHAEYSQRHRRFFGE